MRIAAEFYAQLLRVAPEKIFNVGDPANQNCRQIGSWLFRSEKLLRGPIDHDRVRTAAYGHEGVELTLSSLSVDLQSLAGKVMIHRHDVGVETGGLETLVPISRGVEARPTLVGSGLLAWLFDESLINVIADLLQKP
jgi:hypothetical protein